MKNFYNWRWHTFAETCFRPLFWNLKQYYKQWPWYNNTSNSWCLILALAAWQSEWWRASTQNPVKFHKYLPYNSHISLNALLIGFRGKTCNINIDECASNPCNQRGQCIDGINSYTCNCTGSGYTGPSCSEDVNECQTTKPCHPNATCINHLGTYECNCQLGFTGKNCYENIDDCRSSPCQNGGTHLAFTRPYLCADWIYFMLEIV